MGTYSFRNFKIGEEFKKKFNECSKDKKSRFLCESKVRSEYKTVESGRLHEMGDKIHNFMIPLDKDERLSFKKNFPDVVKIGNEFAVIEELAEI